MENAEVQALYSRPISSYFDVQAGVRQDFTPGQRRTFAVIGVQGLAPYWFEIDTALFVSHDGDLSARFETEYDLRFTQRLILQPRAEANIAFQDVPRFSVDRGLIAFEGGARLRYEFKREVAPYIGVSWEHVAGEPDRRARGYVGKRSVWVFLCRPKDLWVRRSLRAALHLLPDRAGPRGPQGIRERRRPGRIQPDQS